MFSAMSCIPKCLRATRSSRANTASFLRCRHRRFFRSEFAAKVKPDVTLDDVVSHVMYPEVFAGYAKFTREHGELFALPTPAFFYGMKVGQEISVEIESGKTLFIRLVNVGAVDAEGKRAVNFELNG